MADCVDDDDKSEVKFKKSGKKNIRRRVKHESSDEEESEDKLRPRLQSLKELQSMRKRSNGISVASLALGTKLTKEDEMIAKDPFKLQNGGLINMQTLKSGKIKQNDDAYETGIGTQFSVETNKRDEDEEMMKYIEEQLARRKGNRSDEDSQSGDETKLKYCSPEEAALRAVPEHLRKSSTQRSEEMLSNQMLSGIPEVDLGIEAKIKNIEATEEAKLNLLRENMKAKDLPSQFVPSNMAVNFMQHNRFNVDSDVPKKQRKLHDVEIAVDHKAAMTAATAKQLGKHQQQQRGGVGGDEKATDDYHYERFKKQFKKH